MEGIEAAQEHAVREAASFRWPRWYVAATGSRLRSAAPRFDELIHAPTRLSIVALLAATEWADFTFVRDSLELSDSSLSKQVSTLEQAGYVTVRKTGAGRSRRTHLKP